MAYPSEQLGVPSTSVVRHGDGRLWIKSSPPPPQTSMRRKTWALLPAWCWLLLAVRSGGLAWPGVNSCSVPELP